MALYLPNNSSRMECKEISTNVIKSNKSTNNSSRMECKVCCNCVPNADTVLIIVPEWNVKKDNVAAPH